MSEAERRESMGEEVGGEVMDLEERLKLAEIERDEYKDRYLRAHADLENYRKRAAKELEETLRYRNLGLVREMLPAMDNLQRALESAKTSPNIEALVKGVSMVLAQMEGVLNSHQVKSIPAMGTAFDPNLHEAIQQMPSEEHPALTVIQEVERGYQLHDRVIRPTKVIVSAGPGK